LSASRPLGMIDRSFGRDGIVFAAGPEDAWAQVVDAFLLPQRELLAVGWTNVGPSPRPRAHFLLVRLTETGALDSSFERDGRVLTPTGIPATAAFLEGRRLLVAGAGGIDSREVVFARYHIR
jgi:hypothetical protein